MKSINVKRVNHTSGVIIGVVGEKATNERTFVRGANVDANALPSLPAPPLG